MKSFHFPKNTNKRYVKLLHRTLLSEHFRVADRTDFFESAAEIKKDFHLYLKIYNNERSHIIRKMNGRTPYQVLQEAIRKLKKE